jgi:hypothetical protein
MGFDGYAIFAAAGVHSMQAENSIAIRLTL